MYKHFNDQQCPKRIFRRESEKQHIQFVQNIETKKFPIAKSPTDL